MACRVKGWRAGQRVAASVHGQPAEQSTGQSADGTLAARLHWLGRGSPGHTETTDQRSGALGNPQKRRGDDADPVGRG